MKNILIVFIFISGFLNSQTKKEPDSLEDVVFTQAEEMPEPLNGMTEFYKALGKNIRFPKRCLEDSTFHGCKSFVKFIVDEEGFVGNFQILKGCSGFPECDEEAIMGIKKCGRWKPGKQNGKTCKVYFTVPVSFRL